MHFRENVLISFSTDVRTWGIPYITRSSIVL